jgi:hypothetical protein
MRDIPRPHQTAAFSLDAGVGHQVRFVIRYITIRLHLGHSTSRSEPIGPTQAARPSYQDYEKCVAEGYSEARQHTCFDHERRECHVTETASRPTHYRPLLCSPWLSNVIAHSLSPAIVKGPVDF